jgi:hypothetical protein
MAKGRHIPKWLARRTYFKRIERWTKTDRSRRAATTSEAAPAPLPSNVVPFPMRLSRPDRSDFSDLRDVGIA